jgi:ribonucleoside-diphosphate reductase alpha chain
MDSEYKWYGSINKEFFQRDYLLPGQTLSSRVDDICSTFDRYLSRFGLPLLGNKLKQYIKNGWISLSSPIWTNFGTDRGLPCSCYGSTMQDNMESILDVNSEIGMMTKYGGGTSLYLGKLRGRGSKITDNGSSSGSVHFASLIQATVNTISQGSTRRGSCAVYLDIEHPDILEFLKIKSDGFYIQQLSFGVCVPDRFMKKVKDGDAYARQVWATVLQTKRNIGYPYIIFIDNANNNKPDVYRDNNLDITHSNLCTEIFLPDNDIWSFVCNLLSVNLLKFDEFKDTDLLKVLVYLLDVVLEEFILKTTHMKYMQKARDFSIANRALGIGVLGWHSYLQSKMIPFDSLEAMSHNHKIFKYLKEKTYEASAEMFNLIGASPLMSPYKRRHATLLAIAPTVSSSFILGGGTLSKSVEPEPSNYFTKNLAKGKYKIQNPFLKEILANLDKDSDEVWDSILENYGSVQHLDFLDEETKEVFKTLDELSPISIIKQAAQRQKFIDQGQSINIKIHPDMPIKDVNAVYFMAWEEGLKSLYYQYNVNAAQEFSRKLLTCKVCEG